MISASHVSDKEEKVFYFAKFGFGLFPNETEEKKHPSTSSSKLRKRFSVLWLNVKKKWKEKKCPNCRIWISLFENFG